MKKILPVFLLIGLMLMFVGCESDSGESMDEDYAGTWYEVDDDVYKYEFTDSSFVTSEKGSGDSSYIYSKKGTLAKVSDGSVTFDTTHLYADAADAVEMNIAEGWYSKAEVLAIDADSAIYFESGTISYSLSADGTTLTWDGDALSSTEP